MNKSINNKSLKINLLILILIKLILLLLNYVFNLYILIFSINQYPINLIINTLIIISILILINHRLNKLFKNLVNFIAITFLIMNLFFMIFFSSGSRYFYFDVPNTSKALIVKESTSFSSGIIKFYQRKGLVLAKDLKVVESTDDNNRPFSSNQYILNWLDNSCIEVVYYFGNGVYKNVLIKLD